MNLAAFTTAAYAVSAVVIAAMLAWLGVDQRLRKRELAELEARGVRRRSDKARTRGS